MVKDILPLSQIENVAKILYDDWVGDSDLDLPNDEFYPEARAIMSKINNTRSNITQKWINVEMTKIMSDYFDIDFSKYDLENGAYASAAEAIYMYINQASDNH